MAVYWMVRVERNRRFWTSLGEREGRLCDRVRFWSSACVSVSSFNCLANCLALVVSRQT